MKDDRADFAKCLKPAFYTLLLDKNKKGEKIEKKISGVLAVFEPIIFSAKGEGGNSR